MPDYSKGKIYCIRNHVDDEVYVGSTCETLSSRMSKHRYDCKRGKMYCIYEHMRHVGIEACYIELIEEYPCENVGQLNMREGHYMRQMGTLNTCIPGAWATAGNKKGYLKKYHEQNKSTILERVKLWSDENKEKKAEYYKNYRYLNRDKILDQRKEKITCDICGSIVRRDGLAEHKRSKNCQAHAIQ